MTSSLKEPTYIDRYMIIRLLSQIVDFHIIWGFQGFSFLKGIKKIFLKNYLLFSYVCVEYRPSVAVRE